MPSAPVNPEAEGRHYGGCGGAKPPHESGRPKADSKGGVGGEAPHESGRPKADFWGCVGGRSPPTLPHLGPRPNFIKKVGVIDERSLKKSKKHRARASAEAASIVKIIKFS